MAIFSHFSSNAITGEMLLGVRNSKTSEPINADAIAIPTASQRLDPIQDQAKHGIWALMKYPTCPK